MKENFTCYTIFMNLNLHFTKICEYYIIKTNQLFRWEFICHTPFVGLKEIINSTIKLGFVIQSWTYLSFSEIKNIVYNSELYFRKIKF